LNISLISIYPNTRILLLVLLLAGTTTDAFVPSARLLQGSLLKATGEEEFDFSSLKKPDTPSYAEG
jgi:hypothetical protein